MGTPVLASTAEAVREITGDGALQVDPRSHDAMVQGIRRLHRDDALRAKLVAAGTQRAQEFTWKRCAKLSFAAYQRALDASR